MTGRERLKEAVVTIKEELEVRRGELERDGKVLEAQRLHQRTMFDLEMISEIGYCHGIENYSRHLTQRKAGQPPPTLLDYLPSDALIVVDESHQTVPQVRGMYHGDRSRKEVLVEYGFRLPSALDNRPLNFEEWEARVGQLVYVSATPGPYELQKAGGVFVEQVIRPTGLMDPPIEVRPVKGQVDDLLKEIRDRAERKERVLVTTLTKRMAEDLTTYYQELGVKVRYLHSDIDTLERVEILRDLRRGVFDVLVGINLLREGLDLPEVSLVAILDADKEGFLRSGGALIQTSGRAARNVNGRVIMYADMVTDSMRTAINETERRRTRHHSVNARAVELIPDGPRGCARGDAFSEPDTSSYVAPRECRAMSPLLGRTLPHQASNQDKVGSPWASSPRTSRQWMTCSCTRCGTSTTPKTRSCSRCRR